MTHRSDPEIEFESHGPEATEALGAALGERLGAGALLALAGDLGAGKTCFVRGLARGLGSDDPVSSPTYTLAHEYAGRLTLHHLDAWMAERESAFLAAGGEELLDPDGGVCAVEWAGNVAEWLPGPRLELALAHLDPERRRIRIRRVDGLSGVERGLEDAWAWLHGPGPAELAGLTRIRAGGEESTSNPVNRGRRGPLEDA